MDPNEFVSSLEKIYKPLKGHSFEAMYEGRRDNIGPRDILVVQGGPIIATLYRILEEVNELQQEYNRLEGIDEDIERVWKGITTTYGGVKLWVPICENPECGEFQVSDVEVLTDLNWVKDNYVALVNITVVENTEESD